MWRPATGRNEPGIGASRDSRSYLQRHDETDLALYEVSGDLPTMVRSVAGDSTRGMDDERNIFRTYFGIDLSAGELPIPEATFAWSATTPTS